MDWAYPSTDQLGTPSATGTGVTGQATHIPELHAQIMTRIEESFKIKKIEKALVWQAPLLRK